MLLLVLLPTTLYPAAGAQVLVVAAAAVGQRGLQGQLGAAQVPAGSDGPTAGHCVRKGKTLP